MIEAKLLFLAFLTYFFIAFFFYFFLVFLEAFHWLNN